MNRNMKLINALNNIDDELLEEIENPILKNSEKTYKRRWIDMKNIKTKIILFPSLALSLILVIFSFSIYNNPTQFESSSTSLVDLFSIKVYATEGENMYLTENYEIDNKEIELIENVEILLANYSMLMSSVPGLPIKIEVDESLFNDSLIDEIKVTTENGDILTWNKDTGILKNENSIFILDNSGTIYWIPNHNRLENYYDNDIWNDKEMQNVDQIKIMAQKNGKILEEKIVYIGEKNNNYYAIERVNEYRKKK